MIELSKLSYSQEKADCAVRAVSVLTDTPYDKVHSLMSLLGREPQRGTDHWIIHQAITRLGFAMIYYDTPCRTIRTLERDLPNSGAYLISVRGHLAGYRDGKVYDWSAGRCHHIRSVWKIKRFRVLTKFDRQRLVSGTRTPSGNRVFTGYHFV